MVLGIFGSGGFGREVLECVRQIQVNGKKYEKVLFIDDIQEKKNVNGIEVVKYAEFKKLYNTKQAKIFIAIGEVKDRKVLWDLVKEDGYTLETLINPNVWIPETTVVGEGSYIAYGAFISCNIVIGDNSLIMPYVIIGHDSQIGSHCVCSCQSNIAGNCRIDDYCFLGLNSIVREKMTLPQWTIVSAGSAVLGAVNEAGWILSGVPARKMQKNEEHSVFKH